MTASRRIDGVLSIVALLAVLAIYARHGERFTRESAAGRIGTGMLLAMLGFAFVWLASSRSASPSCGGTAATTSRTWDTWSGS